METYKGYFDMGILDEKEIRDIEFGNLGKKEIKSVLPPIENK